MKRVNFFHYFIMTTILLFIALSFCFSSFDANFVETIVASSSRGGSTTSTPTNRAASTSTNRTTFSTTNRAASTSTNPPTTRHARFGGPLLCADFQNLIDRLGKLWKTALILAWENANSQISLSTPKSEKASIHWHADYARAVTDAESQGKMLLIYFCDPGGNCDCNRFKSETLDDPLVCSKLRDYVCLQAPLDASIIADGKKTVLLEHEVFREMLGKPGIAIIDYRTRNPQAYGTVVSAFPITQRLGYTPQKMAAILDLPPGTLTQRTLIYAVRTHPDKPASAQGELSSYLLDEARKQSQYQADIHLQGHHFWESRFQRISAALNGLSPREVCAESWPGENLVEAAVECVRCWRLSDGHWDAVRAPQRVFGYDMKRGTNGIWYATGIFGGR